MSTTGDPPTRIYYTDRIQNLANVLQTVDLRAGHESACIQLAQQIGELVGAYLQLVYQDVRERDARGPGSSAE